MVTYNISITYADYNIEHTITSTVYYDSNEPSYWNINYERNIPQLLQKIIWRIYLTNSQSDINPLINFNNNYNKFHNNNNNINDSCSCIRNYIKNNSLRNVIKGILYIPIGMYVLHTMLVILIYVKHNNWIIFFK